LTDVLLSVVVPAAVTAAMLMALRWKSPSAFRRHFAASASLVSGILTGYFWLDLGPLVPSAHWHWLPYAALATMSAVVVSACCKMPWWLRATVYLAIALALAWLLTPTWEDLHPSRSIQITVWAVYVTIVALLLEPLAARIEGWLLPAILTVTCMSAAAILVLGGSLRFAEIAGCGAGALLGVTMIGTWRRDVPLLVGAALPCAVFMAGALFIGRVNSFSDVPLVSYMLIPLAPLCLWARQMSDESTRPKKRPFLVPTCLALLVLTMAILSAVWTEMAHDSPSQTSRHAIGRRSRSGITQPQHDTHG